MMAARLEKTDTSHEEMVAETKLERDLETMACREMTEACLEEEELTSVDKKPEAAEREVPIKDAEVMLKKLAVARRGTTRCVKVARKTPIDLKMSRRAAVARHKRDIIKSYLIQEKCHPQRELVASRTRMTHCAGVAWCKDNAARKVRARDNMSCRLLEKMDLEECVLITDATLIHLAMGCPRLEKLSLSHCELITDEGIRHLGTSPCAAENLTVLELDNCPLITDASLEHLISCHNLQRIELYDCQLITRAGIRRLRQNHLPNIKVHAYFAPVTPPPTAGGSRQRYCRCCVIL
ncbi:hypothetical protein B7P43_G11858 [Cryptotermes secundus]|uniref:F-box/LRR-repeat protein 20 n=1 Tax=Cryptotermes secundus TaxID=105785 RepID=A0A2J7QKT6_9NEOP|nr:hypothetical protein B7P43_G11858 [Cryptotermes secundus]